MFIYLLLCKCSCRQSNLLIRFCLYFWSRKHHGNYIFSYVNTSLLTSLDPPFELLFLDRTCEKSNRLPRAQSIQRATRKPARINGRGVHPSSYSSHEFGLEEKAWLHIKDPASNETQACHIPWTDCSVCQWLFLRRIKVLLKHDVLSAVHRK